MRCENASASGTTTGTLLLDPTGAGTSVPRLPTFDPQQKFITPSTRTLNTFPKFTPAR